MCIVMEVVIETKLILGHKVQSVYLMIVCILLGLIITIHIGLETIQVPLTKTEELYGIKTAAVQHTGLV